MPYSRQHGKYIIELREAVTTLNQLQDGIHSKEILPREEQKVMPNASQDVIQTIALRRPYNVAKFMACTMP